MRKIIAAAITSALLTKMQMSVMHECGCEEIFVRGLGVSVTT